MSDLFLDVAGGLLDACLDLPMRRRGVDPEPPPLPPGIPSLPPDPTAIARGLDAIRAHDPGFDEAALLAQARAVWHQTVASQGRKAVAGDGLTHVGISAARVGPELETVTVRFGTAAGEEDWVYQRSSTAVTPAHPADAGRCPGCGAPLQLDPTGACPYCHTTVLAAPGWVLAGRNQLRPMTERDAQALAMVTSLASPSTAGAPPPPPPPAAGEGVDTTALGVDAYGLLATVRETVYAVAQARSRRTPGLVAGRIGGELAAALTTEASDTAARHRHHVLAFLEVSDAVITAATRDTTGDRVTVRVRLTGEEYDLGDARMELVEGTQTMRTWSEDWVFTRAAGADAWIAVSSARVDVEGS